MQSVSFHPGVVRTNFGAGRVTRFLYRHAPFLVSPETAGALLVRLATVPASDLVSGGYYVGHKRTRPAVSVDPAKLWERSAEAVAG
jgi:hypothetical protein